MRTLIAMMMMMLFVPIAAAEEETYQKVWLLVMVDGDNDMQEWTRHGLWSSCMSKGAKEIQRHLKVAGEEENPFRYNGFFCDKDEPEPEPVSKVVPQCLNPMRECA